jgi:hypothetical protein
MGRLSAALVLVLTSAAAIGFGWLLHLAPASLTNRTFLAALVVALLPLRWRRGPTSDATRAADGITLARASAVTAITYALVGVSRPLSVPQLASCAAAGYIATLVFGRLPASQ